MILEFIITRVDLRTCVILNIIMKKALFFLSCSLGTLSYQTEGNVLKLGETDFDAALKEYPNMLVKFFAPWCGHCKTLAPTYKEAADALKEAGSSVKVAEVDCTVHRPLCQKYEVKGYPTVHYFSEGNEQPTKYTSPRTKQAIVSWVNEKAPIAKKEEEVREASQQAPQEEIAEKVVEKSQFEKQGNLYKLTSETFGLAQNKFDYLFVKFYAPWCGHCKNMAQTWHDLANSITDPRVAIAEVDCTQHSSTCSSNGVQGYPTLKLFVRGNEAVSYRQARTLESFTSWLEEQKEKLIPGAIPEGKAEERAEEL